MQFIYGKFFIVLIQQILGDLSLVGDYIGD